MSATTTLLETMSQACTKALNQPIHLTPSSGGGGGGGGGGASISVAIDSITGTKYFIKQASLSQSQHGSSTSSNDMLYAEYQGVKEMLETNTIKVPKPIAFGEYHGNNGVSSRGCSFVVFEYLYFCGGGSQYELGQQLAKMHRSQSPNNQFGFHVDNTIGATPQPNLPWKETWADFWDTHRLGHMLKLTNNAGLSNEDVVKLRQKTRDIVSSHNPQPSLIHGDLWGGNKGFAKVSSDGTSNSGSDSDGSKVVPVIFDPATYYGDREADVAMTYLFGGFNGDFYDGYNAEWPLESGHEQRRIVYNLYHILNHDVLFGGMYLRQAKGMIDQIMRM